MVLRLVSLRSVRPDLPDGGEIDTWDRRARKLASPTPPYLERQQPGTENLTIDVATSLPRSVMQVEEPPFVAAAREAQAPELE